MTEEVWLSLTFAILSLYLDTQTEEGEIKLFRKFFDEYKVRDFRHFRLDFFIFRFTLYLAPCLVVRLLAGSESSLLWDRRGWRRGWIGSRELFRKRVTCSTLV